MLVDINGLSLDPHISRQSYTQWPPSFLHSTHTYVIFKIFSYLSIGVGSRRGGGMGIYIWQGEGMASIQGSLIILHVWIFWLIFSHIQSKSLRFCSKKGWFLMILAKFYEKFLPKYKILVSEAQRTVFYSSPALNFPPKVFTKLHDSCSCKIQNFSA